MAKFGLGQVDLNLLARLALSGLTENPERDIASLLRSKQPIEQFTRELLAEALDGQSNKLILKATNRAVAKGFRAYRLRLKRLSVAREVRALIPEFGYEEAILKVSMKGMSQSQISQCYTYLKKLEHWLAECRAEGADQSDEALVVAFIYADISNIPKRAAIKPSLEHLARLLADAEQEFVNARGTEIGGS